ncbi:hypothetical protein [Pedobacter sp. WC2423]|uniref:hypothetical protein n=1 Tax=Pedobacter sp. WC2423 TaxID=3234142 RepID=UPI00346571AA
MGFQKIILEFPAEGFAGETVKHKLTAANLKNQPEILEKGFKLGDEIDIVKPLVQKPIVGDSAATPRTTKKVPVQEILKNIQEAKENITTKGNRERAKEIADAHNVDDVFENPKGEFFTSQNLVMLSVSNDKTKIITHSF